MKRNVRKNGSGGRLRWALLLASAAAFLLVPAAAASAAKAKVIIAGAGSGTVKSIEPQEGTPQINCSSPAPGAGVCLNEPEEFEGFTGVWLEATANPGSEFVGWKVLSGTVLIPSHCKQLPSAPGPTCIVQTFGEEIEVEATFKKGPNVHISIEGEGSGTVVGIPSFPGTPPVNCSYVSPGPKTGVCDTFASTAGPFTGISVEQEAAPGSEFAGWTVEKGVVPEPEACEPMGATCAALLLGPVTEIKIKAKFNKFIPKFKLNLSTSGSGSGSLECDTGSGAEVCKAEYPKDTVVEVLPTANTGSEFVAFSGDCTGGSCELTMDAEKSVDAQFDLESRSLTIEQSGEGTVQCSVNAGPLAPCPASALYGDSIKVVASAAEGYTLKSLTGTGSAAGTCNSETGTCEFELTENSGVSVSFVTAATIATQEENVHGEVPETTSLATSCEGDVDLGLFIPGEEADYEESCILTATSTGQKTELTASDDTGVDTGYLTQKLNPVPFSFSLANPLQTKAVNTGGLGGAVGGAFAPLTSPVSLLTFTEPVSADVVTLDFKQHIGKHDPLHTGTYAKMVTLTLEQTTP